MPFSLAHRCPHLEDAPPSTLGPPPQAYKPIQGILSYIHIVHFSCAVITGFQIWYGMLFCGGARAYVKVQQRVQCKIQICNTA